MEHTWANVLETKAMKGGTYRRIIGGVYYEDVNAEGGRVAIETPWIKIDLDLSNIISLFNGSLGMVCSHCGHEVFQTRDQRYVQCRYCGHYYRMNATSAWVRYVVSGDLQYVAGIELWNSIWEGIDT